MGVTGNSAYKVAQPHKQIQIMKLLRYITNGSREMIGNTQSGMMVKVSAIAEDVDCAEYWFNETDCFDTIEHAESFANESDNPFWFCTVIVEVTNPKTLKVEIEALGRCNYKDGYDFIENSGYFNDMLQSAHDKVA